MLRIMHPNPLNYVSALLLVHAMAMPGCKGKSGINQVNESEAMAAKIASRKGGVVVTIFPIYDLVKQVAGDAVEVHLLLPPGLSVHGYSASPSDIRALGTAKLLVANGGGIDDWMAPAYLNEAPKGLQLVLMMDVLGYDKGRWDTQGAGNYNFGPQKKNADLHTPTDFDEDHAMPGGVNPHRWLVPGDMSKLIHATALKLEQLYPDAAQGFSDREQTVLMNLAQIDDDYEQALKPFKDRRIVTFHDAWGPLAHHFQLDVVATMMDMNTLQATPARILAVKQQIEDLGVRAIFTEPQFPSRIAQRLTGDGVTLRTLDPLGDPTREGYASYMDMMHSNLAQLVDGLKDNPGNQQ